MIDLAMRKEEDKEKAEIRVIGEITNKDAIV